MPSNLDDMMFETLETKMDPAEKQQQVRNIINADKSLESIKAAKKNRRLDRLDTRSYDVKDTTVAPKNIDIDMPSIAVLKADFGILKILVEEGAYDTTSALWMAVLKDKLDIARYLLMWCADWNRTFKYVVQEQRAHHQYNWEKETVSVDKFTLNTFEIAKTRPLILNAIKATQYLGEAIALLKKPQQSPIQQYHTSEQKEPAANKSFKASVRTQVLSKFTKACELDLKFVIDCMVLHLQKHLNQNLKEPNYLIALAEELSNQFKGVGETCEAFIYYRAQFLPLWQQYPVGKDRLFATKEELEKFLTGLNGYQSFLKEIQPKKSENIAESKADSTTTLVLARSGSPLHKESGLVTTPDVTHLSQLSQSA